MPAKTPSVYPSMFELGVPYTCKLTGSRDWEGKTVINFDVDPMLTTRNGDVRSCGMWFDESNYVSDDGQTVDQAKMDQEFMFKELVLALPEGQVFQATRVGKPWRWQITAGFGAVEGPSGAETPSANAPGSTNAPQATQSMPAASNASQGSKHTVSYWDARQLVVDAWFDFSELEQFKTMEEPQQTQIFMCFYKALRDAGLEKGWFRRRDVELLPPKPEADGDLPL